MVTRPDGSEITLRPLADDGGSFYTLSKAGEILATEEEHLCFNRYEPAEFVELLKRAGLATAEYGPAAGDDDETFYYVGRRSSWCSAARHAC